MEPMERDNNANRYSPDPCKRIVRMVLKNRRIYEDQSSEMRATSSDFLF